jgi:fructose-1,6-bisphosphatase I
MAEKISLNDHLLQANVPVDLRNLLLVLSRAGRAIQYALRTTDTGLAGSANHFGEEQIKMDVVSEDIIHSHLHESGLVATYISEEKNDVVELNDAAPYSVVYDPLDGSSLMDVNFAIGSIFGIYEGNEVIGRTPREQAAAMYLLYGPRTILVYGAGSSVHEFMLDDLGEFVLIREFLGVADDAKNYSPGNLRALKDNAGYKKLFDLWMEEEMTLRYSGCMVADVHHILSKGQGVFANVGGKKYPDGKLRLAFECGPLSYLVNLAGGDASDGSIAILDKKIQSVDQRSPIVIGSKNEVLRSCSILTAQD